MNATASAGGSAAIPAHLAAAVARLRDDETLQGSLSDELYAPVLDDGLRRLERAAGRFGPGWRFDREARLVAGRVAAAVRELELGTRIVDNGSALYRALKSAAADGLHELDQRGAESLVRYSVRAPVGPDTMQTLQQVLSAERSAGLTFGAGANGKTLALKVTAEGYQALAEGVGRAAFPR